MSQLKGLIYGRTKERLTEAFLAYQEDPEKNLNALLRLVLDFAQPKIGKAIFDLAEVAETEQDYAQEVAILVWKKLPTFEGDPSAFYHWLGRMCFLTGVNAFNDQIDGGDKRLPLFVESVEEPGTYDDNPGIYHQDSHETPGRTIPESLKPKDRCIVEYLMQGYTHEEIRTIMKLSPEGYKSRLRRMKGK